MPTRLDLTGALGDARRFHGNLMAASAVGVVVLANYGPPYAPFGRIAMAVALCRFVAMFLVTKRYAGADEPVRTFVWRKNTGGAFLELVLWILFAFEALALSNLYTPELETVSTITGFVGAAALILDTRALMLARTVADDEDHIQIRSGMLAGRGRQTLGYNPIWLLYVGRMRRATKPLPSPALEYRAEVGAAADYRSSSPAKMALLRFEPARALTSARRRLHLAAALGTALPLMLGAVVPSLPWVTSLLAAGIPVAVILGHLTFRLNGRPFSVLDVPAWRDFVRMAVAYGVVFAIASRGIHAPMLVAFVAIPIGIRGWMLDASLLCVELPREKNGEVTIAGNQASWSVPANLVTWVPIEGARSSAALSLNDDPTMPPLVIGYSVQLTDEVLPPPARSGVRKPPRPARPSDAATAERPPTRGDLAGLVGEARHSHARMMALAALLLFIVTPRSLAVTTTWSIVAYVSVARWLGGARLTQWSATKLHAGVWRRGVGGAPLEWALWAWAIAQTFGVLRISPLSPLAPWFDAQRAVGAVALLIDTRAYAVAGLQDMVRDKIRIASGYIAMSGETRVGYNLAWLLRIGVKREPSGEGSVPSALLDYRVPPPSSTDPLLTYEPAPTLLEGQRRVRWVSVGSLLFALVAVQAFGNSFLAASPALFAALFTAAMVTLLSFWLPLSSNAVLSVQRKDLKQLWIIAAVVGVFWGFFRSPIDSPTWAALSAVPVAIRAAALDVSILAHDVRGKRRPRYWVAGARAAWSTPLENAVNRRFDATFFSVDARSTSPDVGFAPALARYLTRRWDEFRVVKRRHEEKLERGLGKPGKRLAERDTQR